MKKFRNNRSAILDRVLEEKGLEKDNESSEVDFSMWFPYDKAEEGSKIKLYDHDLMMKLNNKRYVCEKLRESEAKIHIPETMFTNEEIEESKTNGLWFLKHESIEGGEHCWCYLNKEDLQIYTNKEGVLDKHIVQKEVPALDLILDHKYSLRVYLVVINGKCYIYDDAIGKLAPSEYDVDSIDRNKQIESAENAFMFRASTMTKWNKIQSNIYKCLKDVVNVFDEEFKKYDHDKINYMIIGVDILLDLLHKPYFLEFNTYPYLYDRRPDAYIFKYKFLEHFYEFLIDPIFNHTEHGYHRNFVPL